MSNVKFSNNRVISPPPDGMHADPRGCEVTLSLQDYISDDGTRCGIGMSISTTGGDPETSAASRIIKIFTEVVLMDADVISDIVMEYRAKRYPEAATTNPEGTDHE